MTISSHKARALLACLALDLNRPVSAAVLAERLWDDQPPPSAAGTLQSYVSKLRTVLREANARAAAAGAPPVELASRRGTYQLNARPDQVDWQLYLRLGKEARHLAETGADRQALEAFARAQDLWQGEPLAGLPGVWPQLTRTTMYDQWLATTAARVELELRLGRFADLVPELAPLVEQRPQDERLAGQLMTALYGSGRQAEALALFRDTSRRIRADHGTEPAEPLRRLHERMLRGAPVSALLGRSGPPREGQPAGRTGRAPSKLPPAPVLEGRGAELRSLVECARVRPHPGALRGGGPDAGADGPRVAVVTGMPGVGKTALALAAAREVHDDFPDGRCFLRLRGSAGARRPLTAAEAATELLRQLGVPAPEIPLDPDDLAAHCRELLAEQRALVVLDDADHPDQIRPLLPAAPASFVVVTSRHWLTELPAARSVPLQPLPPDAAAALFTRLVGVDRAADQAAVAEVVGRCGGLPFAVEIVASRFRSRPSWSLEVLVRRLRREHGRLGELRHGQVGLTGLLEESYLGLPADGRWALRLLSLYPGADFGTDAAAALLGCPVEEAEQLVESLISVHLLMEHAAERYSFNDLVHEFAEGAAARADAPEDRRAAIRRLVDYLMESADRADRVCFPRRFRLPRADHQPHAYQADRMSGPEPPSEDDLPSWFKSETRSLIALEAYLRRSGDRESAAWLAHLLAGHLDAECLWSEAHAMHREAVRWWRAERADRPELHAQLALGAIESRVSRYPAAADAAERALALARASQDQEGTAESIGRLAELHWHQGDFAGALALQRRVLKIRRILGDDRETVRSLGNIGTLQTLLGDRRSAVRSLAEALALLRGTTDRLTALKLANNIGGLYLDLGEKEKARQSFEYVSTAGEGVLPPFDLATARMNLTDTLELPDEFDLAIRHLDSAVTTFRDIGSQRHEAIARNSRGRALGAKGRFAESAEEYSAALAIAESIQAPAERTAALRGLGEAEVRLGRQDLAVRHLRLSADLAREAESAEDELASLSVLAEFLLRLGRLDEADAVVERCRYLLGRAEAAGPVNLGELPVGHDHFLSEGHRAS